MIPTIYVFSPEWLEPWESAGYQVFYDALHGNDPVWLQRHLTGEYLIENEEGERFVKTIGRGPYRWFVAFQEPVPDYLWVEVRPGPVEWFDQPEIIKVENQVESLSQPPEYTPLTEPYDFRSLYIKDRDTMLYSVTRPGTADPYTVVVAPWKVKGHEAFFTDIYGARSWDYNRMECRFDFPFLQHTWHELQLPGEFTMQLVKDKIDRCYPRPGEVPDCEPVVYRRSIEEVLKTLARNDGQNHQ